MHEIHDTWPDILNLQAQQTAPRPCSPRLRQLCRLAPSAPTAPPTVATGLRDMRLLADRAGVPSPLPASVGTVLTGALMARPLGEVPLIKAHSLAPKRHLWLAMLGAGVVLVSALSVLVTLLAVGLPG